MPACVCVNACVRACDCMHAGLRIANAYPLVSFCNTFITCRSEEVALPVVATKPVTPLLYISTHLNQLATLQNKSRELQTYHLPGKLCVALYALPGCHLDHI